MLHQMVRALVGAIFLVVSLMSTSHAAEPPILRAAHSILMHQRTDGSLVMGASPTSEEKITPYFANFAALGLVAAYGVTHEKDLLAAARAWADWYAAHQNADGTEYDFTGAPGRWKGSGDYDSTDSYAATYLDLLLALYNADHDLTWLTGKRSSITGALAAIKLTLQPIGMTLAKPKWPVMYVMDNTETAQGLRSAALLAHLLHMSDLEHEATALATRMESAIANDLWDAKRQSYLIGLQPDGGRMEGLKEWYPDIMANLMAIAWLPSSERNRALIGRLVAQFDHDIPAEVKSEDNLEHLIWWGFAAQGAGDQALSARIRTALNRFDEHVATFDNPALLGHLCRLLAH
jgi:hypothetical protein